MVKIGEERIVTKLQTERWLHDIFKLKRLSSWRNVYTDSGLTKEADLVGVDYDNSVYAFEVKKEGRDVGSAFDQTAAYCYGANFVYCILEERSVSKASVEKIQKTGIGLLTYEIQKGKILKPTVKIYSMDHKGPFLEKTRSALPEERGRPVCYIFPLDKPEKVKRILHPNPKTKLIYYGYNAKRLPPKGSIIVFYSQTSFVGQGTVIKSRNTKSKDGIKESRVAILWAKSVYEYPTHVPLSDIKDQISTLQGYEGKPLIMKIRRYPRISFNECQMIVQKALERIEWKKWKANKELRATLLND